MAPTTTRHNTVLEAPATPATSATAPIMRAMMTAPQGVGPLPLQLSLPSQWLFRPLLFASILAKKKLSFHIRKTPTCQARLVAGWKPSLKRLGYGLPSSLPQFLQNLLSFHIRQAHICQAHRVPGWKPSLKRLGYGLPLSVPQFLQNQLGFYICQAPICQGQGDLLAKRTFFSPLRTMGASESGPRIPLYRLT